MVAQVYFSNGVLVDNETVVISSGFLAEPDAATSRIYLKFGDFWAAHDVPNDFIVSVTFSKSKGVLYALGRNGIIKYVGNKSKAFTYDNIKGQFKEKWLYDAQERESMSRIRAVNDEVYACGWGGQMYRLAGEQWIPFDKGIEKSKEVHFLDIDGADKDLYAVGMNGKAFYFNGSLWDEIDFPTNCHLQSIHYVSDSEVYIGGALGTLYKGCKNSWSYIGDEDKKENYWAVRKFGKDLFITYANNGMLKLSDDNLLEVDMGLGYKPSTNMLHSGSGKLWSFGAYDLVEYDGTVWNSVSCPDNT